MKINNRLLIVDDDQNIHDDFNKILNPSRVTELDRELREIEASLFDEEDRHNKLAYTVEYIMDHAFQGGEALEMIEQARNENKPYSLMFTDVRIPPGIDGITLVKKVRALAPYTQVVIVTAFSDYTWEEMTEIFGWTDQLLILRKPVDPITVKQVALMLTKKYSSEEELRNHRDQLESIVTKRTEKLMLANQRLSVEIADRQSAEKALHLAHAQLATTNRDLSFEIMQRKQTEEQLKVLLEDLGTANQELENFAYVVSHDLKAPLRAIHSITSWLAEDYIDQLGEEGSEFIDDLLEQTRWMHNLIEGILQYSRLGRVKLEMEELDTLTLTKKLVEMLVVPDDITIEVDHTMPQLVYDRTHLEQVFQNLVENAIKHMNKPEGSITLSCKDCENFWQFSVKDTGIGIADKHHERIFKIFQTLRPRDGSDGSTGIGLSLVKKIVEHHGGNIWVESELGIGSTFIFTVPKDLKVKTRSTGCTVLTIDDNRDFGDVTVAMLKRAGYKPLYAGCGADALAMLRNPSIDINVVLLDVTLPGERVPDLLEKLRELNASMRIVACTGNFMARGVDELRELGIDGVLPKPFNIEELNEVLQTGLVNK